MAHHGAVDAAEQILRCEQHKSEDACSFPCYWADKRCIKPTIMRQQLRHMVRGLCQSWAFDRKGNLTHQQDRALLRRLARHADVPVVTPKKRLPRNDRTLCRELRHFVEKTAREAVRISEHLGLRDVMQRSMLSTAKELLGNEQAGEKASDLIRTMMPDGNTDVKALPMTKFTLRELLVAAKVLKEDMDRDQVKDLRRLVQTVPLTRVMQVEGATHLVNLLRLAHIQNNRKLTALLKSDGELISRAGAVDYKFVNTRDIRKAHFSFLQLDDAKLPVLRGIIDEAKECAENPLFQARAVWKFAPVTLVPQKQPVALFMVGAPARGKGYTLERLLPILFGDGVEADDFALVNADDVRDEFPQYNKLLRLNETAGRHKNLQWADALAATRIHAYASGLGKRIFKNSVDRRVNLIKDGAGRVKSMKLQTDALKAEGYKIIVVRVSAPQQVAHNRMVGRGVGSGRLVPASVMMEIEEAVMSAESTAFYKSVADVMVEVDNSEGGNPVDTFLVGSVEDVRGWDRGPVEDVVSAEESDDDVAAPSADDDFADIDVDDAVML